MGTEADDLYEAIPVWERAYAVSMIKKCVEGAAGTRGADKVIAEGPFNKLPGAPKKINISLRRRAAGIIRLLFCFNYGKMSPLLVQLILGQNAQKSAKIGILHSKRCCDDIVSV